MMHDHLNVISVQMLDRPELSVYSGLSEPQLLHINEPAPGLFIAESPMIIRRALDAGYKPVSFLVEDRGDLSHLLDPILHEPDCTYMEEHQIPIYCAPIEVLVKITGYALTRGILCAMQRRVQPDPFLLLSKVRRLVLLENVMNPTNVGAIFRSAAALGMDGVLLTPGCTDPLYRRSARVSMGTVFQIPWTWLPAWPESFAVLKKAGFQTAAMTLSDDSVSLGEWKIAPQDKVILVMGTEGAGLREETSAACDLRVKIPMYHGVDSLNVAAASAVAFWHLQG